jgi:hypothetical protein
VGRWSCFPKVDNEGNTHRLLTWIVHQLDLDINMQRGPSTTQKCKVLFPSSHSFASLLQSALIWTFSISP